MSRKDSQDNKAEGSQSKEGEPSALSPHGQEQIDAKIAEIIQDLSSSGNLLPPQKERIQHTLREVITTYIERNTDQQLDPEVFRIAANTIEKDNENKFKFLTQKEQNAADKSKREHDLEILQHQDRVKLFWPILATVLFVVVGCLGIGIYLAATGHDNLGIGLITGDAFAVAGYLAGIGTADFFKHK